jgi:hypothetical protein
MTCLSRLATLTPLTPLTALSVTLTRGETQERFTETGNSADSARSCAPALFSSSSRFFTLAAHRDGKSIPYAFRTRGLRIPCKSGTYSSARGLTVRRRRP